MIVEYESLDIETVWVKNLYRECGEWRSELISKPICVAITNGTKIDYLDVGLDEIDSLQIIEFIIDKCKIGKIYYVHNLTFEFFNFLPYFVKGKIKIKTVMSNNIIYSLTIILEDKKIVMRCSYRLTLLSLKDLGILAGIEEKGVFPYNILTEKMKDEYETTPSLFKNNDDYNIFLNKYGKIFQTWEVVREYCINDVIVTKKAINIFWKLIQSRMINKLFSNFIFSAAKLSMSIFFSKKTPVKKKINIKCDWLIRNSYYGGRTEVFGNPYDNEIVLHYDWSGMYGQCMQQNVLGGELFTSSYIENLEEPGYYWIKFKQDLEIPILPVREDKLMFKNGIFNGWYWFEEIKTAEKYGVEILDCKSYIGAQFYKPFLKEFIESNNEIRRMGGLYKQIGKNNNNTFYGRLGMNPKKYVSEITTEEPKTLSSTYTKRNGVYITKTLKENSLSNISISASITSKARIKLYEGMQSVIENNGRILYTDTDSIFAAFDRKDYKEKLDMWMGEVIFRSNDPTTIIEDAVFATPKTYAIRFQNGKDIVKIKGFNVKPNFDEFKKKFYNGEYIDTVTEQWSTSNMNMRRIDRKKKTNLSGLTKRVWEPDLKKTIPVNQLLWIEE